MWIYRYRGINQVYPNFTLANQTQSMRWKSAQSDGEVNQGHQTRYIIGDLDTPEINKKSNLKTAHVCKQVHLSTYQSLLWLL